MSKLVVSLSELSHLVAEVRGWAPLLQYKDKSEYWNGKVELPEFGSVSYQIVASAWSTGDNQVELRIEAPYKVERQRRVDAYSPLGELEAEFNPEVGA